MTALTQATHRIRPLSGLERVAVWHHLKELGEDDLHLRFGMKTTPEKLLKYVQSINLNRDIALGLFDTVNGKMMGFVHGGTYSEKGWPVTEVGISIHPTLQGKGWGTVLLEEVMHRAQALGATKLVVQTLTHNHAIRKILRKKGGAGIVSGQELTAEFPLAESNEWNHMLHHFVDGVEVIEKVVDPSRPTVVFIHGAGGDAWQWRWIVMPELAKQKINSVALSLPYHGDTKKEGGFKEQVELIGAWHQKAGDKNMLVAHSMGGFLTQHHLAKSRTTAPTLLLSSLPPFNVSHLDETFIDKVEDSLKCTQARSNLREILTDAHPVSTERVQAPITWVAGMHDKVVPLDWQRRAAHHYRAPLHVLDGGHNLMTGSAAPRVVDLISEQALAL